MPWNAAHKASLSFTSSLSLLKFMYIESVMLSNHLILCCPLLLLPSIFPSIRVFSSELAFQIRVAKVLELQLQHQSFQWILRVDILLDWQVWAPCSPRDSQESSPALQFEGIHFSALSLLFGPNLTSLHDYWKKTLLRPCGPLSAKWYLCLLIGHLDFLQGASVTNNVLFLRYTNLRCEYCLWCCYFCQWFFISMRSCRWSLLSLKLKCSSSLSVFFI